MFYGLINEVINIIGEDNFYEPEASAAMKLQLRRTLVRFEVDLAFIEARNIVDNLLLTTNNVIRRGNYTDQKSTLSQYCKASGHLIFKLEVTESLVNQINRYSFWSS